MVCPNCGSHSGHALEVAEDGTPKCRNGCDPTTIERELGGTSVPQAVRTSWQSEPLGPIVAGVQAGEIVGPVPEFLARTDGACLLYGGEVHSIFGEPESCKGWITLGAVSSSLTAGESVLYLDFEDTPASIVTRLLALGTQPDAILEHFAYVRPCDPLTAEALTALLDARQYALAVLDGLSEAYALLGLDPYSNADAAKFLALLPRPIAERGAAVLELDHVVKSRETRGRYAIGAQHKLAGIAAAYSTEVIRQPSRTDAGMVKVKIEKDRHGHVRSHAQGGVIALAHITPTEDGERVSVMLEPPDSTAGDGEFRPTALMGKVARYIDDEPGATKSAIRRDVPGKAEYLDAALRALLNEGYVERRKEGTSYKHFPVSPFDENDDRVPESPTTSQRVPDPVAATESPSLTPIRGDSTGPGANGHGNLVDRVRAITAMSNEDEQQRAWQELKEQGS